MEEATGSFLDPLTSLDWTTDCSTLPFRGSSLIQSVYVPDNRGGRVYVAMTDCRFCFCTPGNGPITWHSDLPFAYKRHSVLHVYDYTLTLYGSKLVVIGGILTGLGPINLVWSLNSIQNKWEDLPPMLTSRSSVVAVGYGDHLVAAGGNCGDKICYDVEVFNGKDWKRVKQLPVDPKLSKRLTSVLHTDKKWYIMETNSETFRTTYSAPIEEVISDSPTCEWIKHSAESSPPPGELPPISFDGQLIVVGNNRNYERAKLYFHSPVTDSWVSIENAPYIDKYCNVVGIANLSNRKALMLIYNGSAPTEKCIVKMVTQKAKAQDRDVLDQHFSLSALVKLEYGHNICVLSQLKPLNLRQLKRKVVFDLKPLDKQEMLMGTRDPTVNLYIDSWLQDESAGCRPTWRNLLVILGDIGMREIAKKIQQLLSQHPVTIIAGNNTLSEEILNLQMSLSSVKVACENLEVKEDSRKIIQPVIDYSLLESISVAWAARNAKYEAIARNERLSQEKKTLLQNVTDLQKKALDEKLTAEEHLNRLETELGRISLLSQAKNIKSCVDQCIEMCDMVRKKFIDEKKQLEDQLHQSHGSVGNSDTATGRLIERHIPALLRQLRGHAAKWREIGNNLDFLPTELDNIEARPTLMHGAPKSLLAAMLQEWTQWAPEDSRGSIGFANLKDLKDALKDAGLGVTAHELKL